MATGAMVVKISLLILMQFIGYTVEIRDFPDLGIIQNHVENLERMFDTFIYSASGIQKLTDEYTNNEGDMEFENVDGSSLVSKMSTELGGLLKKKMNALEKSVEKAEELAAAYTWNHDLKMDSVKYENAKKINDTGEGFEYSAKFKQNVNFGYSSVHIPVEIYEGDIDILNGLNWTAGLDEIWEENYKSDPSLLWQFFGSKTGIFRNYPANKWKGTGVDLYDVRRRPWYTQGASSPKDMLILVDTSGSTYGQALALMKQAAKSLLETLGENDFVNVATFSETAQWVGCFHTFVQANYRHKKVLFDYIDKIEAKGMASYSKGLEFAFEEFKLFNGSASNGQGAMCNRIIMFLTDGGTEMPEEVFQKYNWPEKPIRIFSYAVGPTANPVNAARWIACSNRGYFARIPAMGAIRSTVQEHLVYLARPMALNAYYHYMIGAFYQDTMGLGMMTTVTLPVYNRTQDPSNQTILGVMGSDVTTAEMQGFTPWRELGPNGYSFAINANGYIVFHPKLKAQDGWLDDPPNVDFLDIEFENEDKVDLRKQMIDGGTGSKELETKVITQDEMHVDQTKREYFFTKVPGSNFSLGLAIPESNKVFVKRTTSQMPVGTAVELFKDTDTAMLIAPWDYCEGVNTQSNESTYEADLLAHFQHDFQSCDGDLANILFLDAQLTKEVVSEWKKQKPEDVNASFVSTNGGLTRVYPADIASEFEDVKNPWKAQYYSRAMNNDMWIFSATYNSGSVSMDASSPLVTVAKAVKMSNYKPAVAGVKLSQGKMREMMLTQIDDCAQPLVVCYLLDDSGYIIVSSEDDEDREAGRFFGDIDPVLAKKLFNTSVYSIEQEYDYQASCPVPPHTVSAGFRSFYVPTIGPMVAEMMTLKWWTMKFAWLYMNLNLYNWLLTPDTSYVDAAVVESKQNRSCIKLMTQYKFSEGDDSDNKDTVTCGNCTRVFATVKFSQMNLMLVMVDKDCNGECDRSPQPSAPEEVSDPMFSDGNCIIQSRYRARPEACYDFDPREDDTDCGANGLARPSVVVITVHLLTALFLLQYFKNH